MRLGGKLSANQAAECRTKADSLVEADEIRDEPECISSYGGVRAHSELPDRYDSLSRELGCELSMFVDKLGVLRRDCFARIRRIHLCQEMLVTQLANEER